MSGFSIVCLSPAEWDAPLPTNRQQIMRRAAAAGHEVLFVETSDFLGKQLLRLARHGPRRSLVRRLLASEEVTPRVRAAKAVNLLPWGHRYERACAVNNALTARRLRRLVAKLPPPTVAWVYDACAAGVAERLDVAFTVYDCVDDYAQQTRGDARAAAVVAAADRRVAARSRVVFATSRAQSARLGAINRSTHLVPNVADFEHFAPAADPAFAAPAIASLPKPVIGFAGNLLPGKVDFALFAALARARPQWTFVCIGPEAAPGAADELHGLPNLHRFGAQPYGDLPRWIAGFDVGLIPYLANAYTRSCFPLKLYEYLAAGKAVVATGLPELAGMEPDVLLRDGEAEAIDAIEAALDARTPADVARRQAIAARHTWETRASTLLSLVDAELVA